MLTFQLGRSRTIVKRSSLFVDLSLALTGKVNLGKVEGQQYYAFICPRHHMQVNKPTTVIVGGSLGYLCLKCPVCGYERLM